MSSTNTAENPYDRSLNHIINHVLPEVQRTIERDTGKKIASVQFFNDESRKGEEQFQSVAIFGKIVTQYESKETEETSVIVKMQICDEHSLKFNNGGVQFFNENFLYAEILSYFSKFVKDVKDIFPPYVYGFVPENDNRLEDIVILKDLSKENYRLASSKTVLSLEHILLVLKSLGKFHACSYIVKSVDKETFLTKVNRIKEMRGWVTDKKDTHQNFLAKNGERGVKYLARFAEYKDKVETVQQFLNNISESLPRLFEINDRTSVLCHGDLCRNNIFFKYDNSGHPVSVKFFDMATIVYASPVIDLAFLLYMNTSQEQRIQSWDVMMQTYYESLRSTCEAFPEDVVFPSYEEVLAEFKVKSMLGYLSCAFFLPMMMQKVSEDRSVWGKLNDEELIELRLRTSGEEGTKAVGEILKHVIDNGFM